MLMPIKNSRRHFLQHPFPNPAFQIRKLIHGRLSAVKVDFGKHTGDTNLPKINRDISADNAPLTTFAVGYAICGELIGNTRGGAVSKPTEFVSKLI